MFLLPNPSLIASQFVSEIIIHWYRVLQASPFFLFFVSWHVSVQFSRCLAQCCFYIIQAKWLPFLLELNLLFHMISITLLYRSAEINWPGKSIRSPLHFFLPESESLQSKWCLWSPGYPTKWSSSTSCSLLFRVTKSSFLRSGWLKQIKNIVYNPSWVI